jgi:hypothetical protein
MARERAGSNVVDARLMCSSGKEAPDVLTRIYIIDSFGGVVVLGSLAHPVPITGC